MEQRDYLKDQIEQLGRVLGAIISKFFRLKNEGKVQEAIEYSNQTLNESLNLDTDSILNLKGDDLKTFLKDSKIPTEQLEQLSDYLGAIGEIYSKSNPEESARFLAKALEIYQLVTVSTSTISLERLEKEQMIKDKLNTLG